MQTSSLRGVTTRLERLNQFKSKDLPLQVSCQSVKRNGIPRSQNSQTAVESSRKNPCKANDHIPFKSKNPPTQVCCQNVKRNRITKSRNSQAGIESPRLDPCKANDSILHEEKASYEALIDKYLQNIMTKRLQPVRFGSAIWGFLPFIGLIGIVLSGSPVISIIVVFSVLASIPKTRQTWKLWLKAFKSRRQQQNQRKMVIEDRILALSIERSVQHDKKAELKGRMVDTMEVLNQMKREGLINSKTELDDILKKELA